MQKASRNLFRFVWRGTSCEDGFQKRVCVLFLFLFHLLFPRLQLTMSLVPLGHPRFVDMKAGTDSTTCAYNKSAIKLKNNDI